MSQVATTSVGNGPHSIFVSGKYAYTANYLSKNGKTFLIICTLPFSFEGERTRYAEDTRKKLNSFDNFKYIEHNSLREKYGNVGIKAALKKIDELFLDIVNDYIAE